MYGSAEPPYLSYCAIAPIAASSSRAHSRVYEFGGTSVVVPSHSKTSLNAERCSSFVRRASIFVMLCSSRFIPSTNSLHWARDFACSSRVKEVFEWLGTTTEVPPNSYTREWARELLAAIGAMAQYDKYEGPPDS